MALLIVAILSGCFANTQLQPPSAIENSTQRSQLEERISFVEQYVMFDRNYNRLEYDIAYHNNGGGFPPGLSDWDIKILAVVPASEIEEWIPPNISSKTKQPPEWLTVMPGNIATENITEWYEVNGVAIGINRAKSTIAYRNKTQ